MLYGTSDETPPRSGQRDALTRVEVGDGPPLPLSGEINGFEFTEVALATLTDWAVVASLSETVRDYLARWRPGMSTNIFGSPSASRA